jgi:hypothetical protein
MLNRVISLLWSLRETFWLQPKKQAHDAIKCDNTDEYLNNFKIIPQRKVFKFFKHSILSNISDYVVSCLDFLL